MYVFLVLPRTHLQNLMKFSKFRFASAQDVPFILPRHRRSILEDVGTEQHAPRSMKDLAILAYG